MLRRRVPLGSDSLAVRSRMVRMSEECALTARSERLDSILCWDAPSRTTEPSV